MEIITKLMILLILDNLGDSPQRAKGSVSKVGGKVVTNISVASSTVSDLEISPYDTNGQYIAFSTSPHNFTNLNLGFSYLDLILLLIIYKEVLILE